MKKIKISNILQYMAEMSEDFEFIGDENDTISGYSSLTNYVNGTLTWVRNHSFYLEKYKHKHPINLIFLPPNFELDSRIVNCIISDDPHRAFFLVLREFFYTPERICSGNNNYISKTATISDGVVIGNNCTIGENVVIGKGTRIYNNVVIANNVKIGVNCLVKSGAIIGEEGHGHLVDKSGILHRIVHLGGVAIGNNVEIGANTCIDRGALDDTIIGDNVKIDNLCHVAHNCILENGVFLAANTMLAGSVSVGKNTRLISITARNGINIGSNSIVGFGSVVVKNLEDNSVYYGNPTEFKGIK